MQISLPPLLDEVSSVWNEIDMPEKNSASIEVSSLEYETNLEARY